MVWACALGVLAGAGTGYAVQADRPPTPPPPLAQPGLDHADDRPLPAASSQATGDLAKTEGDLRKLLLHRPAGATDLTSGPNHIDGWMGVDDLARNNFLHPGTAFTSLTGQRFRRAAITRWSEHGRLVVEIILVQFRDDDGGASGSTAQEYALNLTVDDTSDGAGTRVPGYVSGTVFVHRKPGYDKTWPGYVAEAVGRHGDLVLQMYVNSTRPVDASYAMSLAKRQLEAL